MPHPAPQLGSDRSHAIERRYRERADDDAQLRIRAAIVTLAAARHQLTVVIESGASQDVRDAAEAARDWLDNADQEAEGALRIAVDASGMVEINERPKYAAVQHVRSKT